MKLYTKPRAVEAVQWFKDGDHPDVYCPGGSGVKPFVVNGHEIDVVDPGDWIVIHYDGRIEVMTDAEVIEGLYSDDELRWHVSNL